MPESAYCDNYKNLVVWKNAAKLRKLIFEITKTFPLNEMRRVSQMRDAARSVKQNIQEGKMRGSRKEFLRYLNISRGSLGELKGDVEDCYEDDLLGKDHFKVCKELICKTDFLFHRLIQSLTEKINA